MVKSRITLQKALGTVVWHRAEGLQSLKSGSLAGVAQGLGKLGEPTKNMGGVMGTVGSTLAETFSNEIGRASCRERV